MWLGFLHTSFAASFDAASKSTNEFGSDLYRTISTGEGNLCLSPYSVSCALAMTLEVRLSNRGAQEMYKWFGFNAVGVRKGYYGDTGEDALVMWSYEVGEPPYRRLLEGIERGIRGTTVVERLRGWS